jgi:hypothetical protein
MGVSCKASVHGVCRDGSSCTFPHELETVTSESYDWYTKGKCTHDSCALRYQRCPYPDDQENEKMPPVTYEIDWLTQDYLESIARHNPRPDPSLPGRHVIQKGSSPIEPIWRNDPNQGPKRPSAKAQQLYEDRQRTPPLPTQPSKAEPAPKDDLIDIEARIRKLKSQVFDTGKTDLFYTLTRSENSTQPKTAVLNIAALQHMSLHQLQYDISYYVGLMYRTSQFHMETQGFAPLAELLNSYCVSACIFSRSHNY